MKLPITIDPRYYDAALFDLDSALTNRDGGFALDLVAAACPVTVLSGLEPPSDSPADG